MYIMIYLSTYKYTICEMKHNFLSHQFAENFPFIPTEGQKRALDSLANYLTDPNPYAVFQLRGYAGTGKTSLLRAVCNVLASLHIPVVLMASTGRAAKVLAETVGRQVHTIHRTIYSSTAATIEQGGHFTLGHQPKNGIIYIVDEASMISEESYDVSVFGSGNLLADLLAFVWQSDGCRLILVGDTAQLPPVGTELSPALNQETLTRQYGMRIHSAELTEVLRQQQDSGILMNATAIRNQIIPNDGTTAEYAIALQTSGYEDILNITGAELIDTLDSAYRKFGAENCLVVAYSNKRALAYNLGIRGQVLDYDERLVRGERLVVARNNYAYAQRKDKSDFIANGDIIRVKRIYHYHEMYGLHFADATIQIEEREENEMEVRLLLDCLTEEEPQLNMQRRKEFYAHLEQDYAHIISIPERRKAIRKDAFWSALEVKYAYAMTCHKAQGGQWPCVFVDMGLLSLFPCDMNLLRWLYTAITRATRQVYLVNTPAQMLETSSL